MSKFENSDITFWSLNFDGDGYSYIHHNINNVADAIRDFADNELGQCDSNGESKETIINKLVDDCLGVIDGPGPNPNIILSIDRKLISVRKLTLDKHNIIHKILSEAYHTVDDNLKKRIDMVFQHSS